jgi:hypothetical protein
MRAFRAMHDEMPCGDVKYIGIGVTRYVELKDEAVRTAISSSCGAPERSTKDIFPDMTSAET